MQPSKREKILETAGKLFMQYGFQTVTVDQIAAAVPVSKPTLYAHFKDKRELFYAVISLRCEQALSVLRAGMAENLDPYSSLSDFANHFLDILLAKEALQFHRVMVGESESFPDMAKMFYESGPSKMHEFLKGHLAKMHKAKRLQVPDPGLAADIFLGMIKGRMHLQILLGIKDGVSTAERKKLVKTAVGIFVRGQTES